MPAGTAGSVTWTCGSCDELISDHGLCNGPADDEVDRAENCPRLAVTVAAWDAEWDALDMDWEVSE
jgi:hypothetical protein